MEFVNGEYQVQGISLLSIAEEYGTPVYVYDGNRVEQQIAKLKKAFDHSNLKLKYAGKALTNINILKIVKNAGGGYDAVSIHEVKLALKAGFEARDIMFTPNCVAFEEIEEAMTYGVHINIDSLPYLEKFGQKYAGTYPVCVRINPHITAGGNKNIQVGHVGSKFGISILQFDKVLEVVEKYQIDIEGVHSHTGSDILDTDVFLRGAEVVFKCAKNFPDLRFLDFGSGFKIAYKEGDMHTDIEKIGAKITESFLAFSERYGQQLELWFEPGKYIVSECGKLLVQTNVVKQTTSTVFVGVNSGQNHLIRPMFYNAYHAIENISNEIGEKKLYSIVGNICESDTFGFDRLLSEVRENDILAISNAGAYGFSMSNQYNARLRPAEVLILDGKPQLIRKRETLEDLYRNEIILDQLSE